jgi:hypothetical protein
VTRLNWVGLSPAALYLVQAYGHVLAPVQQQVGLLLQLDLDGRDFLWRKLVAQLFGKFAGWDMAINPGAITLQPIPVTAMDRLKVCATFELHRVRRGQQPNQIKTRRSGVYQEQTTQSAIGRHRTGTGSRGML